MFLSYYCYVLFLPLLLISSLIIFISSSWISMWMIMEINLISFICLMIFDKNLKMNMSFNYFLIQSMNSYLFLIGSIFLNFNSYYIFMMMLFIMNFSMLMKLSIFPFHMWYINIMKSMNWMNIMLMSTTQKIIPLFCLNNIINIMNNNMFMFYMNMFIILISSFFSTLMGMMQNLLKILMSYSSMIHMSWIIMLMFFNEMMMMNYFIIYSIISFSMYFMFYKFNINNLLDLNFLKFNKNYYYYFFMTMMMCMAGSPPLFGFMMKWISIQSMYTMSFFYIFILIINSLMSMYFYYQIMFSSLMNNMMSMKMNFKKMNYYNNMNFKMILMNWFLVILLIIYEII
nr:NADH dehydrogenase subunit 2 [Hyssopus sp. 1 HHL-2023a]